MEDTKSTETVETPTTETEKVESVTFTQEQVNEMIKDRLARAKKDLPSKDEIAKFKEWEEAQKSEAEKQAEALKELEMLKQEKENTVRENAILKAGVNGDDAEYVLFKVSKMDGEFEANLTKYLEENPKYASKEETKTTGVATVSKPSVDTGVEAILKARHPELYK